MILFPTRIGRAMASWRVPADDDVDARDWVSPWTSQAVPRWDRQMTTAQPSAFSSATWATAAASGSESIA